jgi:hypothetical protein
LPLADVWQSGYPFPVLRLVPIVIVIVACSPRGPAELSDAPGDDTTEAPRRLEGLIRSDDFSRLEIEIDSVPGMEPRPAVVASLEARVSDLVDKPGGVAMASDAALTSQGTSHAWSFAELSALASATFDLDVSADTIKLHTLFVDGHYDEDTGSSKILGIAWGYTSLVMFKQTLEETCSAIVGTELLRQEVCAGAEESVWLHELGHLFGLVDNGLPMVTPHRDSDSEHGAHDANDACVMYWAYEGQAAVDTVLAKVLAAESPVADFDQNCLDDIAALRDYP